MPASADSSPAAAAAARRPVLLADRLRTPQGVGLVLVLVCAATALIHLPSLWHDFVWDDRLLLHDSRLPGQSNPLSALSRRPQTADIEDTLSVRNLGPVAALSLRLDLKLSRGRPWLFHLTNLILACAGAVLVALVAWELLHSGIWAGLAGLLFAAHSSHVESVAFISGRPQLLLGLFLNLAAFALLRSIRKRNPAWWPLVVAGLVLALLSSRDAVLFPLLIALTPFLTQTRFSRWFWLPVIGSIAAAWLLLPQPASPFATVPALQPSVLPRLLNAANTFGSYLRMFVWPFAHRVWIPRDPLFFGLTSNVLYAVIFLVFMPLLALRRRYRLVLWGYFWTVVSLLPVVFDLPPGVQAAERLVYLPSAAMTLLAVTGLSRLVAGQERLRQIVAIALGAFVIFNATDSLVRMRIWRSDRTLFSTMVHESPRTPTAWAGLARSIAPAEPDSAIALYNRAILLNQGYVRAHVEIGKLYGRAGDTRRALHHLRLAEQLRPNSAEVLGNLSLAWLAAGQHDSALTKAELALLLGPQLPDTAFAAVACNQALAIDSTSIPALHQQSLLFLGRGDTAAARALMEHVLGIRPDLDGLRRLARLLN